jgi:hypothetical protein
MPGLYNHTSRAVGLTLTANIYNSDHINHITNHIPTMMDDYSINAAQMQTTADPYPAGAESLATSLAGEIERIRYVIKQITGKAQWYIDPDASVIITNYRSGFNCRQATATTITVQGGIIEANGVTITKTSDTTLDLTVAGDWVDDTSDRAVSTYGYIYINNAGKIEMDSVAPDASDTSDNTTGILRYNNTGTDTSWRRMIGWFYMNSTGSGELSSYEVGNLKDGDVHNSVVRTDSTQNAVNDTTYGTDLTNTQVHFYSSGRGLVNVRCHINGNINGINEFVAILNDGSDIAASEAGGEPGTNGAAKNSSSATVVHAEVYAQGVITFEAKARVEANVWTVEEKTMIIYEA